MLEKICKDPFRLFFPMGLLFAILGTSGWVRFAFVSGGTYPGLNHAEAMIGGFVLLFTVGFLMTAIPRFTKTAFASIGELATSAFLALGLLLSYILSHRLLFYSAVSLFLIFLIFYAGRRFIRRKSNPPSSVLFLPIGILAGLISSLVVLLSIVTQGELGLLSADQTNMLFFKVMPLALIVGVGSRLVPGVLGWTDIVQAQREVYERPLPFLKVIPSLMWFLAASFILGTVIKMLSFSWAFYLGQSVWVIVLAVIAFKYWQFHRIPPGANAFKWSVLLACWGIVLGELSLIFLSEFKLHLEHLTFILGFSLLTLIIASRVTLGHSPGGEGLKVEKNWRPYALIAGMLLLAALTRVTAYFMPEHYINHLGYAALVWILACIAWGWVFLPYVLRVYR